MSKRIDPCTPPSPSSATFRRAAGARVRGLCRRQAKARWFVGPDDWEKSNLKLDFTRRRPRDRERRSAGRSGPLYNAAYQDIVPNERIVLTYEMHLDKTASRCRSAPPSSSRPGRAPGSSIPSRRSFLDGHDDAGGREHGTRALFDNLEAALDKPT